MDFSKIDAAVEGDTPRPDPAPYVEGRALHYDADFAAYQCGFRYNEESLSKSIDNLSVLLETLRIMAGAEKIVLHLTMGDKSGRYEAAQVKPYQDDRNKNRDPGLQERVSELRHWMANCTQDNVVPRPYTDREADDGLCQAMWQAKLHNREHLDVLMSKDKDLLMVGGLHMDPETFEITEYPWDYGHTWVDATGSAKTLKGKGTSFFWHQLLMGDKADNIPGLPFFSTEIVREYFPTAAVQKAEERLAKATGPAATRKARNALLKAVGSLRPKAVGAVRAYEYLEDIGNDVDAFHRVLAAYTSYYGKETYTFESHRGEEITCSAGTMMLEQATLLWMQREHLQGPMHFFREITNA